MERKSGRHTADCRRTIDRSGGVGPSSVWGDAVNRLTRQYLPTVIERIADMPTGTLGFRVTGEVGREDYDNVLTPELNRALEAGPLRTLYVIETLDKMEPAALWADTKLGFDLGIRHRDAWVRSAIVTDIDWMARATKLFAWMIPGEVRVFPLAESEQAKSWIADS
jgi:SpoIIAA-like